MKADYQAIVEEMLHEHDGTGWEWLLHQIHWRNTVLLQIWSYLVTSLQWFSDVFPVQFAFKTWSCWVGGMEVRSLWRLLGMCQCYQAAFTYACGIFFQISLFDGISDLLLPRQVRVVSNLPYNLTTSCLQLLLPMSHRFSQLFFMIQDEVAKRVSMQDPGPSEYRAMTVYCQFYSDPIYKLKISKGAYYPQPKVDGALVEFTLKQEQERGLLKDDTEFITMVSLRSTATEVKLLCDQHDTCVVSRPNFVLDVSLSTYVLIIMPESKDSEAYDPVENVPDYLLNIKQCQRAVIFMGNHCNWPVSLCPPGEQVLCWKEENAAQQPGPIVSSRFCDRSANGMWNERNSKSSRAHCGPIHISLQVFGIFRVRQ